MTDICLLNLVIHPAIEDTFSDWLLARDEVDGFSSYKISGHGGSERVMNLAEKVAGRRRQLLFQLHLPCDIGNILIEQILQDFKGSGIHYWLVPVLAAGHVE